MWGLKAFLNPETDLGTKNKLLPPTKNSTWPRYTQRQNYVENDGVFYFRRVRVKELCHSGNISDDF